MKRNLLLLFKKSSLLAILIFFFCVIEPKGTYAFVIRVTGFDSSRNPAPLTGFVPNGYFEEDPSVGLREDLLDPANFGPGGTVSCSVDFLPFVSNISSGSLVANGQKKVEVFFAGLSNADLTTEEANELASFIRAGGIVYIAGGGYSSYQGLGVPGHDGSRFNNLFTSLGISDTFPAGEVVDFYPCGESSEPIATPVTTGPFGTIGSLAHDTFNPINTSSLENVATGFKELCFIGLSLDPKFGKSVSTQVAGEQEGRTILAEGQFGQGYLSVSGQDFYTYAEFDTNRKNYFLNLFARACSEGSDQPPVPFLDLPWDYEGKGLSFSEAATAIGSYFDHEYPILDVRSVFDEPEEAKNTLTNYQGRFRSNLNYSGHDGYDWFKKARVREGDSVLAAASGTATFYKVGKRNGACGSSACGNVVVIDHGNGYQTRYYHLQDNDPISQSFATPRFVNQGDVIGKVGSTGKSSAPHIHFSVIRDKNGDGDFQDNRPDGLTDPFGWQSKDPDPWPNYTFTYKGVERTGSESYYLWTKPIANLSKELTANGGYFQLERYTLNFPQGETNDPLKVEMKYVPVVTISDILEGIGSALFLNVVDATGNPITSFPEEFTLTIDFSNFDLSKYDLGTLSVYSSNDGISWIKEDTQIDLANKIATTSLNHASYFTLAAEKKDTVPPTTQVILEGSEGEGGWFRSDVKVSLDSQDNEGGSGVYYIGYKIGEEDYFKEYSEPLFITEEGEYRVEFYSVDNDENIEEVKQVSFHIDKTPPEAKIEFNPQKKDTEVSIIDENPGEVIFEDLEGRFKSDLIIIKDIAGNTLKLDGKFKRMDKFDTYSIESLRYGDAEEFKFDKNFFLSSFTLNKKSQGFGKVLQSWFEKGETRLSIIYDGKKDESWIFKKEKGEEIKKEKRSGLVLLYVRTNNGNLEFGYE